MDEKSDHGPQLGYGRLKAALKVMKSQTFFPRPSDLQAHNTVVVRTLGLDSPDGRYFQRGKAWHRQQVLRDDGFLVNVLEGYNTRGSIGYTRQEEYVKVNFWLGGRHTTVLDGYGQHDHDRPEVFITAGPWEMVKVDLCGRDTPIAAVAVCLKRDFFPKQMGIDIDQLPEPLRGMFMPEERSSFEFHRFALSADLAGASRSILAAPFEVRREPIYIQAKAVELMCLLVHYLHGHGSRTGEQGASLRRRESQLRQAQQLLTHRFTEEWTLEKICMEVGVSKTALTSGFRRLFGMSVFDWLQRVRMERAYEYLKHDADTIGRIAERVGYPRSCNFSTAFRAYFGCTPQAVRKSHA
jgi:AraC-like DNA-binding protein